jgi:hypothetical protein
MTGYSLDVAFKEWHYLRTHRADFRKLALLTDDQLLTWVAWFTQFFTNADIRIFDSEDEAKRWLEGEPLPEEPVLH